MRKTYVIPNIDIYYNEELMGNTFNGESGEGQSNNTPGGGGGNGGAKRNTFVFGDDSNILPTVSMND